MFRISPVVRNALLKLGHVCINWDRSRIVDDPGFLRCYNCHSIGHVSAKCISAQVCRRWAETGHDGKGCPNLSKAPCCANCKRVGKNSLHSVLSSDCSYYGHQLDAVVRATRYV